MKEWEGSGEFRKLLTQTVVVSLHLVLSYLFFIKPQLWHQHWILIQTICVTDLKELVETVHKCREKIKILWKVFLRSFLWRKFEQIWLHIGVCRGGEFSNIHTYTWHTAYYMESSMKFMNEKENRKEAAPQPTAHSIQTT